MKSPLSGEHRQTIPKLVACGRPVLKIIKQLWKNTKLWCQKMSWPRVGPIAAGPRCPDAPVPPTSPPEDIASK